MASVTNRLTKSQIIKPPPFLEDNIHYETIMGSQAYGCNDPDKSDFDIYGFCMPPKDILFPHTGGIIFGFDKNYRKFEVYEQHHILEGTKEYDLNIYNIVKYFRLCADGNPNMVDSLFTPANCLLHITNIGNIVRDNRKLFLSKKCWHSFKGYAYAQMASINPANKNKPKKTTTSKRASDIEKYGYDVKFAYHVVRLINEVEQILVEGDLDLQRNREQLKSIRRGEWKQEDIVNYFNEKEKQLEKVYLETNVIPNLVREDEIKQVLLNCLEEHYQDLSKVVYMSSKDDKYIKVLRDIKQIVDEVL